MKKEYSGVLLEPITIYDTIFSQSLKPENEGKYEAIEKRTGALFDHYKIDRDDDEAWFQLAISLAFDHVPGFEHIAYSEIQNPKGGRQLKWDPFRLVGLYLDVWDLQNRRGLSVNAACSALSKKTNSDYCEVSPQTLRKRYYDFIKTPWLKVFKASWVYTIQVEQGLIKSKEETEPLTDAQRAIAQEFIESGG